MGENEAQKLQLSSQPRSDNGGGCPGQAPAPGLKLPSKSLRPLPTEDPHGKTCSLPGPATTGPAASSLGAQGTSSAGPQLPSGVPFISHTGSIQERTLSPQVTFLC